MNTLSLHRWTAAFLLALAAELHAHPFWIQPRSFVVPQEQALPYTLEVGHGAERERSAIAPRRILRFGSIDPLGRAGDLRATLDRTRTQDGQVHLQVPGMHVLYLVTDDRARSHLPATRFNAYLNEEGLTAALARRREAGALGRAGSERYRRVAKALVQVGPAGEGGQNGVGAVLGLPLEIVLERSPSQRPRSARLPVHVIYAGKPLQGGLVKLTEIDRATPPLAALRTDAAGNVLFSMPRTGRWRLDVVWTVAAEGADGVDFDTVFSSLVFSAGE